MQHSNATYDLGDVEYHNPANQCHAPQIGCRIGVQLRGHKEVSQFNTGYTRPHYTHKKPTDPWPSSGATTQTRKFRVDQASPCA